MADWWLPELNPKGLSQGDVLRALVSGTAPMPFRSLRSQMLRGGKSGWAESVWTPDHQGVGHYLASGKLVPCLVVSHSCELDDPKEDSRVLIAPTKLLSDFNENDREIVLNQLNIPLIPLQDIPGLQDCCADLRNIQSLRRALVDSTERVVSMSETALKNLQAHLVSFFTRITVPPDEIKSEI